MAAQREIEWFRLNDDGDSIGLFPLKTNSAGDYYCPQCGKVCTYDEGVIEQDFMGNDIEGYSYDCYDCWIGSEMEEI